MSTGQTQVAAGSMRTDTLADSVLILLALTVLQRGIGFLRTVLFCRWLDAGQLGQWDMAFGFIVLAPPLIVLAIPGAFKRYVEHYRQQSQLRTLLRRTMLVCGGLSLGAAAVIYGASSSFSWLIFGTTDHADLVAILAFAVLTAIAFNFFTELFSALRNVRVVSRLQLINSLAFAVIGATLLFVWRKDSASIILAYGGACLVSAALAACYLARAWPALPQTMTPLTHRALWSKLVPFAGWVCVMNLLANLFELADRYMLIHWSLPDGTDPLVTVGQYHSSRVMPLLLASVAGLLATLVTPHFSCDWEAGRRDHLRLRLNLFIKLTAIGLNCGAILVLFAAPLLFDVAFEGKFSSGLAVLPWTLVYCNWFGIALVAQNYLWCAEKARLASVGLLAGLAVNVVLNALLVPRMGLLGAVLATSIANLVVLLIVFGFAYRLGFHVDRGMWVILAASLALVLGPWIALAVLAMVVIEAVCSDRLLSPAEKQLLIAAAARYADKARSVRFVTRLAAADAAEPRRFVDAGTPPQPPAGPSRG